MPKKQSGKWKEQDVAIVAIVCGILGFGAALLITSPAHPYTIPKLPLPSNEIMIGNTTISCGQVIGEGNDTAGYLNCSVNQGSGFEFNMSIRLYQ